MNGVSAGDVLRAWERGVRQPAALRALALLELAHPQSDRRELAGLPAGRRNHRLLSLRERLFGGYVRALAACPACGEKVEIDFQLRDVVMRHDVMADHPDPMDVETGGIRASVRLPDTTDLVAAGQAADVPSGRRVLFERCVIHAEADDGRKVAASELPEEMMDLASDLMAQADPQANAQFHLSCPDCKHEWTDDFDIGAFLWEEVRSSALRLLREVHDIASHYGWSEAVILGMSNERRQLYLEMIRA